MYKRIILCLGLAALLSGISSCSLHSSQSRSYSKSGQHRPSPWVGKPKVVWTDIQQLSTRKLVALKGKTTNNQIKSGWIELALIAKANSRDTQTLVREILAWRERHPSHPGNTVLPSIRTLNSLLKPHQPKNIAILLPQTGRYASAGRSVRSGILNAYYSNSSKTNGQRVKFYDTGTVTPAVAYKTAIREGADFIIGPLTKDQVMKLRKSGSMKQPILALNYTSPGFFGLPKNFFEFGLKPEDEATQVAKRAHRNGLSRALVIAPNNKWGNRLTSAFLSTWKSSGGTVTDALYYKANADFNTEVPKLLKIDIAADKKLNQEQKNKYILSSQRRHDFDVIFLFAKPAQARTIVPMLRYYYTGDVPVYATSAVYGGKPNASRDVDLNGVIVCDIPWGARGGRIKDGAPSKRLYAVGKDAYTLSQNFERLNKLPGFPIYGSTGALIMSSSQQVYRRIPCTPIRSTA